MTELERMRKGHRIGAVIIGIGVGCVFGAGWGVLVYGALYFVLAGCDLL